MRKTVSLLLAFLMVGVLLLSCNDVDGAGLDTTFSEVSISGEEDRAEKLRLAFLAEANEVIVTENSVTFTDGPGRLVTVEKNPNRTVILYTSFTTLWYEAGGSAVGCIGGNTAASLYRDYIGRDITQDDGVTAVATASSAKKWDVENIFALQPDLIICSAAMDGYATIQAPAAATDTPVIVMEYDDFSDYLKWFKVFCHLTGHPELWDSVAMKALDEVVDVLLSCPTENTPAVFCMFSGAEALSANTSHTVLGDMIHAMHATNIVDAWDNAADVERLDINLETVFAANPDVIVVQCHAGADAAKELVERLYGSHPVWQSLKAVREGRVYYLEKNLFHNKPNSRFSEAYATLAGYLSPAAN